jgi:hypothetical protein
MHAAYGMWLARANVHSRHFGLCLASASACTGHSFILSVVHWTINLQALPRPPPPFCHLSLPYFFTSNEDPESMTAMDDSRSTTLHEEKSSRPASRDGEKSVLPSRASVNEKETEAGVATSPHPSVNEKPEHEQEVHATKMDGHDLSKIKTSETGVEYPHGLKLGLISLALCLSVFLMALVFLHRNCSVKTSN